MIRLSGTLLTRQIIISEDNHVDHTTRHIRYLIAHCRRTSVNSDEPDAIDQTWCPPLEDPADRDPIVAATWVFLEEITEQWRHFPHHIRELSAKASEHYISFAMRGPR